MNKVKLILLTVMIFIIILLILLMPIITSFWTIAFIFLYKYNRKKRIKYLEEKKVYFQMNKFIKMMSMFSQANNYNILNSLEETTEYLEDDFKEDIDIVIADLKMNYNFEKSFEYLINKYHYIHTFNNFITNLIIIKNQSNIMNSGQKMFELSSNEMQNQIVFEDKVNNLRENHFKNFCINIILGYIVILIVIINMFTYYYGYAKAFQGIIFNNLMIFCIFYAIYYLTNSIYKIKGNNDK